MCVRCCQERDHGQRKMYVRGLIDVSFFMFKVVVSSLSLFRR